jgi:mitogen-activated protein kinase 1/3
LESLFPAADPAAINLLKSMLMFNPAKRCTAEEALDHEFLKPVRKKELEVSS